MRVTNLSHLDRGYYEFDKKLQALGADVERVTEDEKNVFSDAEVEALFVK